MQQAEAKQHSPSSVRKHADKPSARLPGFFKLTVHERLELLHERGLLNADDYRQLRDGTLGLGVEKADKMIENVIAVQGMPVGLGLNFIINGRDYVVPLAVEEPSIVAALSSAAKLVRDCGGFAARSTQPILIGQVQVVDIANMARAKAQVLARKEEIINLANSLHPNMVARGGGAQDIEVHTYPAPETGGEMLVVHILVDTCDAMGANLVNTMCEGVAPLVETITGGKVFLRILSNLTDRALVWSEMVVPVDKLATATHTGEEVRDGIILANDLATVDPYRAATHNKGIMNGVDAVCIASGNDWRALEAAVHAYAARSGQYSSLTRWYKNDAGDLVGSIEIPIKVGTVGGPLQSNPTVAVNHRLLGISGARELAEVMGTVGLAQNFSALRALVTDGIQQGHMTLHARSVTMAAGAPPELFDKVVEKLLQDGEIKIWKAREILANMQGTHALSLVGGTDRHDDAAEWSEGHGKIILFGEHAVVYGSHAIAAPVSLAVRAKVEEGGGETVLSIPRWGVEQYLQDDTQQAGSFLSSLRMLMERLQLTHRHFNVTIAPDVPRARGLGGSSAMAVAVIRALDRHCELNLSDDDVCALAFECEKIAHGTPSGIDNAVATYGKPLLYRRNGQQREMQSLTLHQPLPLVIGLCQSESLTARMVGRVRQAWQKSPALYQRIFDAIDSLTLQALEALKRGDWMQLGELMNICQGQLNALQVSSWELEELMQIARQHGAAGAKLTGGGGGGAMIALCPDGTARVAAAMRQQGYEAMEVQFG